MNRGVWTGPWGVVKQPQRARVRGQRAVIVKSKVMRPQRLCADARRRCCDATRGSHLSTCTATAAALPMPRLSAPPWLRDLAGAWIFYSVLPAWPAPAPRFERIARFAPWIGAVLGALQGLLWWALEGRVPLLAQVALVLALGLWLSGGLHMDGVMDSADGLAAGDRCLEAMADSRVGASGVQALALV
ncbi:adenosylcobinamide-GDP ribazoletransferase, partial [Synechococcus sp. BA-120 BA3]|nr:adenosylcobinamide-GDP ribazoletransferase [Synechococcus sp. BA-120 BA3]